MKKLNALLLSLLPIMVMAQTSQPDLGITFFKANSWTEILAEAKKERKPIFLDAYTTWCGPCKKMDTEVYTDPQVGAYVNANFVPVKIQMDQTKKDDEKQKAWYSDVEYLFANYPINAFPTYLFIDAEGKLIDRGLGFQSVEAFLTLLKKVNDPHESYIAQLKRFKTGEIKGQPLLKLARKSKALGDTTLAIEIAKSYKSTVIEKTDARDLLNADLRDFIFDFQSLFTLDDHIIQYLYSNQALVDERLENKGFSQRFIDYLIRRDMISTVIKQQNTYSKDEPDWNHLINEISEKYDITTAKRLIINAKINWYTENKDWANAIKYNIEKIESYGLDTIGDVAHVNINNIVYEIIFDHSDDPSILRKGLSYMETVLRQNPNFYNYIDTYANLLYKLRRKDEAIRYEEKALNLAIDKQDKNGIQEIREVIKKMKNGEPTWTTEN